jgi:hypothetical protein
MLACGAECQPNEIIREIEKFPSSTSPVRVATDAGEGFVKSPGNPMGNAALISELVAAELGRWFGLRIPPFAVVTRCDIEITMTRNGVAIAPPLFFSLAVDGTPRDGGDTFLSRLRDPGDVAKLVVFDTWIRNWDRFLNGDGNDNNLLYVKAATGRKYDLVPIDHSNCFIGDDIAFPIGPVPEDWVNDPNVYGKFPEFDPYINARNVHSAIDCLATLKRADVVEIVNSVPPEWGLGVYAATALVDLICERAAFVVNSLPARLVDEPEIPGLVP